MSLLKAIWSWCEVTRFESVYPKDSAMFAVHSFWENNRLQQPLKFLVWIVLFQILGYWISLYHILLNSVLEVQPIIFVGGIRSGYLRACFWFSEDELISWVFLSLVKSFCSRSGNICFSFPLKWLQWFLGENPVSELWNILNRCCYY